MEQFTICEKGVVHMDGEPCRCGDEFSPHPDITASHHHNNEFSAEANPEKSKKKQDMELIYAEYVRRGPSGAVREDVYLSLGFISQTGSARCSDLAREKRIVPVWNENGSRKRGRTKTNSPAGIECADIYGRPRPNQPVTEAVAKHPVANLGLPDESEL